MVCRSWRSQTERTPNGEMDYPLLGEFVGDVRLSPGRLVNRHGHDRFFDCGRNPVLQDRLAARQLLKRQFAAWS